MTIKEMTLGATINLQNFENLRIEIKTNVNDANDIAQTKQLLDNILGTYGRNDPVVAKHIDSYRTRVLSGKTTETTPENCEAKGTKACDTCPEAPKKEPTHGVDGRKRMTFNKPPAKAATTTSKPVANKPAAKQPPAKAATLTSGPTSKKDPAETQSGRKSVPGIKFKGNLAGQESKQSKIPEQPAPPKKEAGTGDKSKCSICGASLRPNETKFSKTMAGRDDICKVCAIAMVKEKRQKMKAKNNP